ncbi:hypothetical protein AB6A40_010828 [Gnathostoma spinigerum]|uniref:Uncharacterized protein n=1 Tax=Gnathostoma spinigerum TaxID=75299 RepID=A0ABD6EVY5_9BILA
MIAKLLIVFVVLCSISEATESTERAKRQFMYGGTSAISPYPVAAVSPYVYPYARYPAYPGYGYGLGYGGVGGYGYAPSYGRLAYGSPYGYGYAAPVGYASYGYRYGYPYTGYGYPYGGGVYGGWMKHKLARKV